MYFAQDKIMLAVLITYYDNFLEYRKCKLGFIEPNNPVA